MTVKEGLDLLQYGTDWELIGGKTGKKLCDTHNKKETREKYIQNTLAVYTQNTSLTCFGGEIQRTKCQELQMALRLV